MELDELVDDSDDDPSFAESSATELVDSSTLDLKVMNVEYTDSPVGTLTHLFGRTRGGEWRHIEVEGHRPSFFVHEDEYEQSIDNHYAVVDTEKYDNGGSATSNNSGDRYESIIGEPLVRVYTTSPEMVGEMQELFDRTWEADVLYENRWLIDNEVKTGVRIDTSDADYSDYVTGDMRVSNDDVTPLSADDTPSAEPKQLVVDIEVAAENGVPDADVADAPVSTIVAWDSYSESYIGWILEADEWGSRTRERVQYEHDPEHTGIDELKVFSDESALLDDFHRYIGTQRPDIITGWYSNDFDIPYLINRSKNLNVYSYDQWSPLGEVWDGHFDPNVSGVSTVDMLAAYQKTQIHNLDSKSLDAVAAKELDHSKVDLDRSHTEMWRESPIEFLRYNKVDVELVHEIDDESGAVDLLDNLRTVVGCSYEDPLGGNIDMMDMLFIRRAREYGIVLPTAEKPEKDWYYGAKVFEPSAGVSENVVYLDLASLYPNLIKQLNVSPEMIREDEPVGEHSTAFIDTRSDGVKKDTDPQTEEIYYSQSSRGFVASLVDELIEMKNEYRGTDMYAAVKRITNSVYGVLSDSDSYGDGFRLFDWRMGESICLAGREVITECSNLALEWCEDNGYEDAYIKMGDTDGFGICLPSADGMEESLRAGYEMETYVNEQLPSVSAELFSIEESENEMEIECESYASKVFVKGENDGESDVGVRKKYVQRMRWEK